MVDLATTDYDNKGFYLVNSILLLFILLTFGSNAVSIWMLTKVQSQTKLSSYQEVAYWISKGNRGYIFLISLMKVIYLVTACAYCMQFIANYLTVITEVLLGYANVDFAHMSPWGIWAIYVCWLLVISGVSFVFYKH